MGLLDMSSRSWIFHVFFFLQSHILLKKKNCQCQGHNEGLYNQNMTISTFSSKLLVCLQPNLVQHHKPGCAVEKWDCCIQGHRCSEGSKCQWMFVRTTEDFFTKPGMDMQHPNRGWPCSMSRSLAISVVPCKLLVSLQPNLFWTYSFISQSVL